MVAQVKDGYWQYQSESISVCLEQGNVGMFKMPNIFVMSDEQYSVVYWYQLPHSLFITIVPVLFDRSLLDVWCTSPKLKPLLLLDQPVFSLDRQQHV